MGGEGGVAGGGVEDAARDVHGDGEDDFVLVAEVHEGAEGQTFGRGELEGVGGDAGGEMPVDFGGLAGVAGVDPVDVPAGLHLEVEAGGEGLAGVELGGRDEEGDGEVGSGQGGLGRLRRGSGRQRREETARSNGQWGRGRMRRLCFLL